jgi:chemotaxis protein histidine kinase CheA
MVTLTEYFETEARERLAELERGLRRHPHEPDALHRAARAVRGAAQIARETRVCRAAGALEAAMKAASAGDLAWSDAVAAHARATLDDIAWLLDHADDEDARDARVDGVVRRWTDAGVRVAPHVTGSFAEAAADAAASREFREFAAREVAAIADALDAGLQQLGERPTDREPLRTILLRQRALLGAARLDELPVVAEILRAVQDLTRVIARLDVAVKREWLEIFRIARDALRGTLGPLQRHEVPPVTHPVSRLRHMRGELLQRYGSEDDAADRDAGTLRQLMPFDFTSAPSAVMQDARPAIGGGGREGAAGRSGTDDDGEVMVLGEDVIVELGPEFIVTSPADAVVAVEDLAYTPDAALRRALALQDTILRAAAGDPRARDAADELFDLIRLALG